MRKVEDIQADLKDVLDNLAKDAETKPYREVFAIAFDHAGNPCTYFSGNWQNLGKAAAFFQAYFNQYFTEGN